MEVSAALGFLGHKGGASSHQWPCPRSNPLGQTVYLFHRLGSESISSFRKSDPLEAEVREERDIQPE